MTRTGAATGNPCRWPYRRWEALCVFLLLAAPATRQWIGALWRGDLATLKTRYPYLAGSLAINYFQFGAVRRGLGGSIAIALSRDAGSATLFFYFAASVLFAWGAALLFRRIDASSPLRLAFAVCAVLIVLRWREEPGRTDVLVGAALVLAALAISRGRPILAAVAIGIGLFVHEACLVFGVPLMLALTLQAGADGPARRDRAGMVAVIGLALLLYAGMGALPHATNEEIVQVLRSRLPPDDAVEWAMYFALSGGRGIRTSICENVADPTYWTHLCGGAIVIVLANLALLGRTHRDWAMGLLASVPGFVFLSVIANDMARWSLLAVLVIWLVACAAPTTGRAVPEGRWTRPLLGCVLGLLVVAPASSVPNRYFAPSPVFEAAVRRMGGPPTPGLAEALRTCDPHWRDVLDAPRANPEPNAATFPR